MKDGQCKEKMIEKNYINLFHYFSQGLSNSVERGKESKLSDRDFVFNKKIRFYN